MFGIIIAILFGMFGGYQFYKGNVKKGILYLFTLGLFGIGWIIDIVKAISDYKSSDKDNQDITQNPYIVNNSAFQNMQQASKIYFSTNDKIEAMWSVLYNLNCFSGEKAYSLETLCLQNIKNLDNMLNCNKLANFDDSIPPHVPAYVRLAMLYEKQERYKDAINICVEAIQRGAVNDNSKGQMYGRLARLISKSGIEVDQEILLLSMQ